MNKKEENNPGIIQVIPFGGLGEIGKNMMAIRYAEEIIIIDVGLGFPSEEHYGVDYILPDTSYLIDNQHLIKAIILTHGHEDHIGGLNDFLKKFSVPLPPVYGTKLTIGLVEDKLSKGKLLDRLSLRIVQPRHRIQFGNLSVEFIKVCHSIADSVGLAIFTPLGTIVHTGDFKLDPTPVDGIISDYYRFADLGEKGVLLLMSDSTNVTKPGFTPSEKEVAPALINSIGSALGRVIVTTFASNIHRVQQIIKIASRFKRKIILLGRSMERVTKKAIHLGYMDVDGVEFIKLNEIDNYQDHELLILTTGAQGEPMSALSRISSGEHKITVVPGDTVIISAVPIPGNEKMVFNTINNLFAKGAEVIYESYNILHVSGHASAEELKLMLNLTRPKYFVPIHGETRHLIHHAELAESLRIKGENIFVMKNGEVLEISAENASISETVPAGNILIDGSGIGHLEEDILRDRHTLSREGVIFVSFTVNQDFLVNTPPKIVSKGFILNESVDNFCQKASDYLQEKLIDLVQDDPELELYDLELKTIEILRSYSYLNTKRKPNVITAIHQV